ncbi:MAG TPA: adenosylmethionine--8-amino-7-oxononanoate transaminase [Gaiellaceae bacterium]|jgi:adenosylmethionine---8-amino-7-oxononanoate aminotransferase
MSEWIERDASRVWHGFTQMASFPVQEPVIVDRAEGRELIDSEGRRYLDAISSLWVTTLGHRVPDLDAAVTEQLGKVAHSTMLGNGNRAVVELCEALARVVPLTDPHFLFASDGSSAVEQALKCALQYWRNIGLEQKSGFLALRDAYHGDTIGALSLGDGFHSEHFDQLRFPVLRADGYATPNWAEQACNMIAANAERLAAVVIEPLVQAAGGMQVARPEDVRRLAKCCRENGVLLVCDEVATGFGRTGSLFASRRCGIQPDLLVLGKGITGGYLPMSVTVASGRIYLAFMGEDLGPRTFYHGHSYGGNALAAAVASRHLELLAEWNVLSNVEARSEELRQLLTERIAPLRAVTGVRLCGLLGGVELAPWASAREVCSEAVRRGVLLRSLGQVVPLVPPLTITSDELERIVSTLEQAIAAVSENGADA